MLTDLVYRLRALLQRRRFDADLDDELRLHLELQAGKYMRAGLDRDAAFRRATLELGGMTQVAEATREAWGVRLVETTIEDLCHAARVFAKSPVFTAAIVLSLALGIGANTAIFTLMDAVMWRSLPIDDPEGLLVVGRVQGEAVEPGFTYGQFRAMHDRATLARIAGYANAPVNISVDGPAEASLQGLLVTGNYFSLVGVGAAVGRSIGPEDDRLVNGHTVVMLSDGYWRRRFAGDPAVIGRTIRLSGMPFTIIGIAPPGFFGAEIGSAPDLFVPIVMQPTVMPAFENLLENPIVTRSWVQVVGRIAERVERQRAASELELLLRPDDEKRRAAFKQGLPPSSIALVPATAVSSLRQQFSQPLVVLLSMVGVVLLIACANTANLLLSRAAVRSAEFAMRAALGASRARLLRQLLTESLLLALVAGGVGVVVAYWATQVLVAYMSIGRTPITLDTSPNLRVLAFTALVSVLTGLIFGVAPGRRATNLDLIQTLHGLRTSLMRNLRTDRVLSVVQLALSLTLLVGAGLFVRTLSALSGSDDAGLRERVVMLRVEPRGSDQRNIPGTSERLDRIYQELIERVERIPGVLSASMANGIPTAPTSTSSARVQSKQGEPVRVPSLMVYPGYFATLDIAVVAGREFEPRDLAENAPGVCLVNQSFVRRFFDGRHAIGEPCYIGRRMQLQISANDVPLAEEAFTIVGVVEDSRYSNPRGETRPLVYQTFLQTNTGRGQMVLHLRTETSISEVIPRVRQAVAAIDPSMPMFDVHTLAEEMQAALVQQRLMALLASLFGGLALLLASVGLYGLFAFSVVQRRTEIGLRMAVGARRTQVTWLVFGDAMRLIAVGIGIGAPASFALGKLAANRIGGLLFGLDVSDPATIVGASVVMAGVAALAVLLPALQATRVDPLTVLRST